MKTSIIKKNILFILLLLLSDALFSQGWVETPLSTNGFLVQKSNEMRERSMDLRLGSITDTITLDSSGFLDDFSYEGPYPDTSKWLNNYVFINRDLPIAPPTLGVATFDGVDANGYPYDFLAGMYSSGKADTLTSKPIDLYYPGDTSVYFSFYFQPQGRGNFPDPADSLILEFKTPITGAWHHVWAKKGLNAAFADSTWQLVMLHITDSTYLRKGFQFRFSNWATLSGNGDHWHIDYVYLRKNRTATDTLFKDIAITYNTPSLLKTYSAVPWEQYDSILMKKNYDVQIRNNNNTASFGSFKYRIFDNNGVQVDTTYTGGNFNYDPFFPNGYSTYPQFATPLINYTIPPLTGKTSYTIESFVGGSPNKILPSDTVRHKQIFDNYYAYDDGTAEVSFGLAGFLHAQIAERFITFFPDTLRGIDIYFNPQWTDASAFTFKLKVWGPGASGPGTLLYLNPTVDTPKYNQTGHDKFTRYYFDSPLYLNSGTMFYIGFDQNTSQPINIGVDVNTNSQSEVFYNTTGGWTNAPYSGSIMMHPVMGTAADAVGISEKTVPENKFVVYPNPASDRLFIRSAPDVEKKLSCCILDISGRTILVKDLFTSEALDISGLSNGVYFIRIINERSVSTQKIIISR